MTRTRGGATWADMDPHGCLRVAQTKDEQAWVIGPSGIVGAGEKRGWGAY